MLAIPAALVNHFQPDRAPHEREGGLHGVLDACFPIDARVDGTGPVLEYRGYELVDDDGYLACRAVLRLSWWTSDAIDAVLEQPCDLATFCPDHGRPYPSPLIAFDRDPEEVLAHLSGIIYDRRAAAQSNIARATRETTPADLVFE